ncbi:MAG: sodium:solute symporter [Planctomycetota bacterium]
MNLSIFDWVIVTLCIGFISVAAIKTKKYTHSVVDFLAASRCGGRYLLAVSANMVNVAAISTIGYFEMFYEAGFCPAWWNMLNVPVMTFLAITGWCIYRYRETRAMTLGQFFEIRYSKKFRIFTGLLAWLCGIVNFGIFPAVGASFFVYFCGLPDCTTLGPVTVPTRALVMFVLLSIALFFTFAGGQIAIMVTNYLQGMLCTFSQILIITFLLFKFDWSKVAETLSATSKGMSLINPFETSKIPDFNIWYFLMLIALWSYTIMSWQGNQGYNCSAKSAHEFRMARVLSMLNAAGFYSMFLLLPICAYVVLHHGDYTDIADAVRVNLGAISSNPEHALRKQLTVPIVLSRILPTGFLGLFCAFMFAAFLSTHNTYLHSWGSIFIQDVILPFRKKPFSPKQHMLFLRLSIVFVAVFIFFFGLWFRQTQQIFMFMHITGSIYLGGVGVVIIGGLYWPKGTTAAAWVAMIFGSAAAIAAVIAQQIWARVYRSSFPINSMYITFFIMCTCILLYGIVSLLTGKTKFNLQQMLGRGKYASDSDKENEQLTDARGLKVFLGTEKLTLHDKIIFAIVGIWTLGWFAVFIFGTIQHAVFGISDPGWLAFWRVFIWISYGLLVAIFVLFLVGGSKDLSGLFRDLRSTVRNYADDGMVVNHKSLDEKVAVSSELTTENR